MEEATVALHAASDKSKIASLTRLRDQAQADVDLTKSRIAQMEIKAPIAGFVVFGFNYSQGYLNAKPFKVGDNAFSGMILAEMPDLDTLELDAKVEETDRGRIAVNQEAACPRRFPPRTHHARQHRTHLPARRTELRRGLPPAASTPTPPSPIPIRACVPA